MKIDKNITKDQVKKFFESADKDGGGIIDFAEFYAAMQNVGQDGDDGQDSDRVLT